MFKNGDKVRIKSAELPTYWYASRVGEIFTLLDNNEYDGDWIVSEFNGLVSVNDIELVLEKGLEFNPIYCRDRIKEIDSLVESLEEERASLVQALEDEGLSLIEKINKQLEDCKQSHEDMSDWKNWKAGDLLTLSKGALDYDFTVGKNYGFIRVDEDGDILVLDDSGEENGYQVTAEMFKWHSRPQ